MLEKGRYFGEHQQLNSWTAIGRSHPSRTLRKCRENQVAESEWMDGVISGSNLPVTEALATRQSLKSLYSEPQPVLLAAWPSYTGSLGSEAASCESHHPLCPVCSVPDSYIHRAPWKSFRAALPVKFRAPLSWASFPTSPSL